MIKVTKASGLNTNMRSTNNNKSSGLQSRIKSPVKQRRLCKNQRTRRDSGKHSPAESLQNVSLDDTIPLPRLSFATSALLVAILSFITYWNSCHGDFVFDDLEAILKNQDVRSETPLWSLFQHDFWGKPIELKESHKSYRPLTVLTFRISYYLAGGLYPWGFHFVNIILHAIVSVLVLPVSSALLTVKVDAGKMGEEGFMESPKASLLCAILFAVHPIHTENVAGIVGRADLLCALFFFMSFLMYTSVCKSDSSCLYPSPLYSFLRLTLSMVLCALAMLCKEQGITVIGLCSVYDIIIHCGIDPIPALYTTYTTLKHHLALPAEQFPLRSQELEWLRRLLLRQLVLITSAILLLITR